VQLPIDTVVNTPAEVMVHTSGVVDVKVTAGPPVGLDVAVRVGLAPKFTAPGFGKLMVRVGFGVTLPEGADAGLDAPAVFVATTVNE
jgi:hypothetical protein